MSRLSFAPTPPSSPLFLIACVLYSFSFKSHAIFSHGIERETERGNIYELYHRVNSRKNPITALKYSRGGYRMGQQSGEAKHRRTNKIE